MRLAVSPTLPGLDAGEVVRLCRLAEDLGYREAWVAEVAGPEAFAIAGAIAQATTSLDVGVAVVAAATRTPAVLAMAAGTVSQLLDGRRFALGIGASSEVIVERWHGRPFDRPLTRVREAVEATRAALHGDRDYDGHTTSMHRFRLASSPLGPVEIFVGALNPGMLGIAGAVGDGACLNLMPPRVVQQQRREIAAGAERSGHALADDFVVMARLHLVPADDLVAGRDVVRQAFGPYFAQPVYNRFLAWCGYPDAAAAIDEAFRRGDREGVAVAMTDELVDDIALVGNVDRLVARLHEYGEAGVTVAALNVIADGATIGGTLREIAARY